MPKAKKKQLKQKALLFKYILKTLRTTILVLQI